MGILNGGLLNRPGDGGTTTTTGSGITETEARALIADWAEQGHARPSVGFLVSVERTMATQPDRDTPSEVSLSATSGLNNYVLRIDENPDSSEQLSAGFLTDMEIGAEIEIRQGSTTRWHGSVTSLDDISGEPNARSVRINFSTLTGTFTTGQAVIVRFGYISDPQIYRNVLYLAVNAPLPDISSLEEFHRHDNTIVIRGRNSYQSLHRHIPATDASGTWSAFTSSDDANFIGPRTTDPATAAANEYYYNYLTHHWRQTTFLQNAYHWQNAGDSVIDGNSDAVFIGEFSRRVDATNSVSTTGQDPNDTYFAYFLGQIQVLDGSTFVEHVDGSNIFEWLKVGTDTEGNSLVDLGTYDATYNYHRSDVIETEDDGFFISLTNDNLGNTPVDSPDEWEAWGGRNPRSYYVTEGLTTRQPRTLAVTDVVNTDGVLSFDDTVFQVVSGGVQGLSLTDIQDETDADPTVDATNGAIGIPAGTYDISLEFYGNQDPSSGIFLSFFKIESGDDDVEEFATRTQQQNFFIGDTSDDDDDIDAVYRVEEHDIVLDQDEKFYLQLVNFTGYTNAATQNRIAGYIRIEAVR